MFHSPNTDLFELNKFTFTNFFTTFSQKKTWENVFSTKIRLWRIFSLPFFNFQKCFVWIFTLSFFSQKKEIVKMFRSRHSLNNIWSLPGLLSTLFFNLQSFDFFSTQGFHRKSCENVSFRFGHVTSLTGDCTATDWSEVLQSVSVLRPEQSAMRLLRSHWKAQQILSNANWVIKRFLC